MSGFVFASYAVTVGAVAVAVAGAWLRMRKAERP